MPRKPGRDRRLIAKKRKFANNQHTIEAETEFASTSAKKLKAADYDDVEIYPANYYVVLNFLLVFNYLSTILKCKVCDSDVTFTRTAERGVGFKLIVKCQCGKNQVQSSPEVRGAYEINRRLVFTMRLLGQGLQGIQTFLGLMDFSIRFSNTMYYSCLNNIHIAAQAVFNIIRTRAVAEEMDGNRERGDEPTHLAVSGDGTWKKRGFSSLFGVTSLIGKYSRKVIDIVVKSSHCLACLKKKQSDPENFYEWFESHENVCLSNHTGSAGKMEVDCVAEMFSRSDKLLGVKYKYYIGDGDCKTFKGILDLNPYADLTVEKKECIGHVEKRMGTRLRNVKKAKKGLGGKGRGKLTDKLIKDLTIYYGLAIRRHSDSVDDMKKAIWATYFHKCSTNDHPQHQNCPAGEKSWCKWQVAAAAGQLDDFEHEPPISKDVQDAIKPIYEALSLDDLLVRCLGGNTQNSNESLNACIWRLAPKHLHSGKKVIETATFLAVGLFNEGHSSLLKTMETMGIIVGCNANNFAEIADATRVDHAERKLTPAARAAMEEQRMARLEEKSSMRKRRF